MLIATSKKTELFELNISKTRDAITKHTTLHKAPSLFNVKSRCSPKIALLKKSETNTKEMDNTAEK